MEQLKNMSLRKSFFLLTLCGLLTAVALAAALWAVCAAISSQYPLGGVTIGSDGVMMPLPQPTPEQMRILRAMGVIPLVGLVLFPAAGLAGAGALFYRWKLKEPIRILLEGTERIQAHDLDFTVSQPSADEMGQVCAAFETMRAELLRTNRELWRQGEERKRLNAAFAHDLRNPITVLKGSVKLLDQDPLDPAWRPASPSTRSAAAITSSSATWATLWDSPWIGRPKRALSSKRSKVMPTSVR